MSSQKKIDRLIDRGYMKSSDIDSYTMEQLAGTGLLTRTELKIRSGMYMNYTIPSQVTGYKTVC